MKGSGITTCALRIVIVTDRKGPMAQPLHDASFFARVSIEHGALVWPNGWDASADFVQEEMRRAGTLEGKMAAAE